MHPEFEIVGLNREFLKNVGSFAISEFLFGAVFFPLSQIVFVSP